MNTTSISLLEQVRQARDQRAWGHFASLYTPLLYYWARHLGCQPQDAADLVQEVYVILIQKLPEFSYDRHKSFRGWLRTILLNKWRDKQRRHREQPVSPGNSAFAALTTSDDCPPQDEAEHRRYLLHRALAIAQAEFQPSTWKACWGCVVEGRSAAEVAADLGLSLGAVYVAKSRVLARLRRELKDLND